MSKQKRSKHQTRNNQNESATDKLAGNVLTPKQVLIIVVGIGALMVFLFNLERFFPDPSLQYTLPSQPIEVPVDLSSGTHPGAALTLIEFTDFQCPFCNAAVPILNQLEQQYGENLNIVVAHFPVEELHPYAQKAAEAAECARAQHHFWEYHDLLFQNQAATQDALAVGQLLQYAEILELNMPQFTKCLTEDEMEDRVQQDFAAGMRSGVQGTPTFFANGIKIEGVQPITSFTLVFDAALETGIEPDERANERAISPSVRDPTGGNS